MRYATTTVRKEFNKFDTFIIRACYELKNLYLYNMNSNDSDDLYNIIILISLYAHERKAFSARPKP